MRQSCHTAWAINTFGKATLGDPRRTQRLIKLSAAMAANPGCSIVKTTDTSADMEGAYRFLRNELVDVNAIAEAGFQATIKKPISMACYWHLKIRLRLVTNIAHYVMNWAI